MILQGDALAELRKLPDKCCSVCVTSPPYYNARDYGVADQLGTESSPEEYTRKMVEIFREVARVLKDDGTLWLNIGDSYARHIEDGGIKRKDLIGIPWLLALALRSDGWYLRADIIWNKPNAMPESAKDRPARSHEYVFLLSKAAAYYYDAEAVKELAVGYDPKKPGRKRGNAKTFLSGIVRMTGDLVKAYPFLSDAEAQRFGTGKEEIGKCPRCGSPVYVGKGNFYCSNKDCSFCLWEDNKFFSSKKKKLTKKIAKELLDKGWCRVTGLYTPKKPQLYDAVIRLDDSGGKYVSFKMEFDR